MKGEEKNNIINIQPPNNVKNILFHCCCAPCSGGIIRTLLHSGITPTVLFYNPNIHPEEEYALRKATLMTFLEKLMLPFIDADYDPDRWLSATAGLKDEPQRGKRCTVCFELRLDYTAHIAKEKGFSVFATSCGISRWKDMDQVNRAGEKAAQKYGVTYWDYNWRKHGGQDLMREVTRQEDCYQQTYCGCRYSIP